MRKEHQIIIFLLLVNIGATFWFGFQKPDSTQPTPVQETFKHNLPEIITKEVVDNIFTKFKLHFNNEDYDEMYNMFGDVTKNQVSKEAANKEFKMLIGFFKHIESGAYTHSKYISSEGNTSFYQIYYNVSFSQNDLSKQNGYLQITVAVQGNSYQIYGMRLNNQ